MTRTFTIAAILAVGLIAASCSGNDSDSGVASLATPAESTETVEETQSGENTGEPVSDEEAVLAFAACLRDEGVEVEDPTVDADGNGISNRSVQCVPRSVSGGRFRIHAILSRSARWKRHRQRCCRWHIGLAGNG
mgnify:CR=1 FL=1